MEALSRVSNGDLRKAITTLQSAVRLKGPQVRPLLCALHLCLDMSMATACDFLC